LDKNSQPKNENADTKVGALREFEINRYKVRNLRHIRAVADV